MFFDKVVLSEFYKVKIQQLSEKKKHAFDYIMLIHQVLWQYTNFIYNFNLRKQITNFKITKLSTKRTFIEIYKYNIIEH